MIETCHCSFCCKNQHEVLVLIAAPVRTFICDECVALCVEIVEERRTLALRKNGHRQMLWGDIGIDPGAALGWCR